MLLTLSVAMYIMYTCMCTCKKQSPDWSALFAPYWCWQRIPLPTRSDSVGNTVFIPAVQTSLNGKTQQLVVLPDLVFTSSLQTTAVYFWSDLKKAKYCHDVNLLKLFIPTISSAFPRCDIFLKLLSVMNREGRGSVTERTRLCVCDWLGRSIDRNVKLHDLL